jgi:hypothetical protein
MSADNSICILQSRGKDGKPEYRVAHVQNVEVAHDNHDEVARDEYLRHYFEKVCVFRDRGKAFKHAAHLYDQEYFVEYGIVSVNIGKPFPTLAVASTAPNGGEESAPSTHRLGKRRKRSRLYQQVNRLQRRSTKLRHQVNWLTHCVKELEKRLAAR